MSFRIGSVPVDGRVSLAPMASISDTPFRLLCRRMGAGFSFTEFVSTDAIIRYDRRSLEKFRFNEEERPVIFQIFGSDPDVLVRAAVIAAELGPDVIDLNMGCSVRKVAMRGAGAALLRDPVRTGAIVESIRKKINVPVTAKIRLGWDEKSRNYLEIVRVLEESGIAMISVHGRTRAQAYTGRADWDAIGEIKSGVSVPVLGNGDVQSHDEALEKIRIYGVDGVLIGRAAIGNPWIFSGRNNISIKEIVDTALQHLHSMAEFYDRPMLLFRKHAAKYFTGFTGAATVRREMMACESISDFERICGNLQGVNSEQDSSLRKVG